MMRCLLWMSAMLVVGATPWVRTQKRQTNLVQLTEDNKQSVVDKHNELRESVGASNMEYMMWDEDLAAGAAILADTCTYEHAYLTWDGSPFAGDVGQNIFSSSGDFGPSWAEDFWWQEKDYYNFDTGACSWQCDHYTQMAWWNNIKVGCAKAHCQPLCTPGAGCQSNAYYFVCNYAPGGNFQDQSPFLLGEGCSECESRMNDCWDGLCLSQAVCDEHNLEGCTCSIHCLNCGKLEDGQCYCDCAPGWFGLSCGEECIDVAPECGVDWTVDMCNAPDTRQQMLSLCPHTCGVCEAMDETVFAEWCATTEAPPTTHVSTTLGSPTTTTMYQQLCYLYGIFCDMARAVETTNKRRTALERE